VPPAIDQVIAKLRANESTLRAAGIVSLALHGSLVRGEATVSSDVDLLAEFDNEKKLSLFSLVGLENQLTDILGVKADLANWKTLRPEVLERAQIESVLVF
jgi:predicted nucleotidyltransferase